MANWRLSIGSLDGLWVEVSGFDQATVMYYIIDKYCLISVELCDRNASEKEIDITCK